MWDGEVTCWTKEEAWASQMFIDIIGDIHLGISK